MNKAKENYIVGRQKIVKADELEKECLGTVPLDSKRFICLNCGEYVTYVRSYKVKSYFRHSNRNDATIDCELRCASDANHSIYEKNGPQIYIKKIGEKKFELYFALYGIPEKIIEECHNKKYSIKILASKTDEFVEYRVNKTRFIEHTTSKFRIQIFSNRYHINYGSLEKEKLLKKFWGTDIEGFSNKLALFSFSENGGRKFRINDEITTDTDYYLVSDKYYQIPKFLSMGSEYLGTLEMKSGSYAQKFNVTKIRFINTNKNKFTISHNYCREFLKVSLVYKPAKLELLWPPAYENNNEINFLEHENNPMFVMYSEEIEHKIFLHHFDNCIIKSGNKFDEHKSLFIIELKNNNFAVSINEKYNSINWTLSHNLNRIENITNDFKYWIYDYNENLILIGIINKIPNKKQITVKASSRSVIIHKRYNHFYKKYDIKDHSGITIKNIAYGDEIVSLQGLVETSLLEIQRSIDMSSISVVDDELFDLLNNRKTDPIVKTPSWMKLILCRLERNTKIYKIVEGYIKDNKLPIGALRILQSRKIWGE